MDNIKADDEEMKVTAEQLRATREANPFTIHLADGRSLHVLHRDFVSQSPGGRTIIVYAANESFSIVDLYLETELKVATNSNPSTKND